MKRWHRVGRLMFMAGLAGMALLIGGSLIGAIVTVFAEGYWLLGLFLILGLVLLTGLLLGGADREP